MQDDADFYMNSECEASMFKAVSFEIKVLNFWLATKSMRCNDM